MEQWLLVSAVGYVPGALRGWFEAGISEWGKDSRRMLARRGGALDPCGGESQLWI